MNQFDVCRNTGRNRLIPYVVVQSSCFAAARRRVVVPLVSWDELSKVTLLPTSTINPVFIVEGARLS